MALRLWEHLWEEEMTADGVAREVGTEGFGVTAQEGSGWCRFG